MKKIVSTLLALLPVLAYAQVSITFENQDYRSIGVYDAWEDSPFTTGELQGHVAVVANDQLQSVDELYGYAPNPSSRLLAFQRSRYAGNLYGARIDLKETFELTPTTRYVHCLLWKPTAGRVMCIALGKRQERAGQSPMTPQCWALSTNTAIPGHWCDMVFPINGAGGIDIHSLVIVPDCESPHRLTEDFACYIDNVCVCEDSEPALGSETDDEQPTYDDGLCRVTANQLNGDVLTADGKKMEVLQVPLGKPLTIRMDPAPGFTYQGVRVRHGHNLDGPQMRRGRPQWQEIEFTARQFRRGKLTLPARVMDGDVQIEGLFTPLTGKSKR